MKILILSDIHAMSRELEKLDGGYAGPSGGILRAEDRTPVDNQILAIEDVLLEFGQDIDLTLCLGDLTHQAKQLPLMAAWADIHTISANLGIENVIGIVGNHDVMSRASTHSEVEAITDFLQSISPSFPSGDEEFNRTYFATGVASIELGACELVCLNTSRTHGLGFGQELTAEVFEKGSLTANMVGSVVDIVKQSDKGHVVVAMHHHPIPVTDRDDDNDQMRRGEQLLERLSNSGKRVLLLHGHKHYVKCHSFGAGANAVPILSAASLCAYPFDNEQTHFSNQFHVVEFDTAETQVARGRILSWDWAANRWVESTRAHMPAEVYFGAAPDLNEIATRLREFELAAFAAIDELLAEIPSLKYIQLSDLEAINEALRDSGRRLVVVSSKVSGMIYEEDAA